MEEEPERVEFIAEYGESHLDDIVMEIAISKGESYKAEPITARLLRSPSIKDSTIKTIIEKYPKHLEGSSVRDLYRKDLSKEAVDMLVNHLKTVDGHDNGAFTRLLINQSKHIKEADLKKLDWKGDDRVKTAVMYREDTSEKFLIDTIKTVNSKMSMTVIRENKKNKNYESSAVLNAIIEQYLSFDRLDYNHEFHMFGSYDDIPLNPKLLVDIVQKLSKLNSYESNMVYFTSNVSFPDYGLDDLPITRDTIDAALSSPGITIKRAESLIMKVDTQDLAEKVMYAFPKNKVLVGVSDNAKIHVLKQLPTKGYWFRFMASGKMVDNILSDLDTWKKYIQTEYTIEKLKWKLLEEISQNKYITNAQRKKILDIKDSIVKEEGITYGLDKIERNIITTKSVDESFIDEVAEIDPQFIWYVWTEQSSTYFQYNMNDIKKIDKIALKTPNAPDKVLKGISNKSFNGWIDYSNQAYGGQRVKGVRMDKKKAKKYLLHFIETGSNEIKTLLKTDFIDKEWLEDSDVSAAMYTMTDDVKYLPEEAKDIFLF